jgi:hypothetical protein
MTTRPRWRCVDAQTPGISKSALPIGRPHIPLSASPPAVSPTTRSGRLLAACSRRPPLHHPVLSPLAIRSLDPSFPSKKRSAHGHGHASLRRHAPPAGRRLGAGGEAAAAELAARAAVVVLPRAGPAPRVHRGGGGGAQGVRGPAAGPQHAVPDLRRQHGRAAPQGAGGGVLRHHVDVPQGAGVRDAHRRRRHHAGGPQPLEAGAQGAVPGARHQAALQVQDHLPVLPRLPQRRGAVPPPQGRRLPGEGQPRQGGRRPELPQHRQERQPHRRQVHRQGHLRLITLHVRRTPQPGSKLKNFFY